MELTVIEMVAYQAAHATEAEPWRCVLCDRLTPVSDSDVLVHFAGAHGIEAEELRVERDMVFWYPPKTGEVD